MSAASLDLLGAQPMTFSAAANATGSRADKDAGFDAAIWLNRWPVGFDFLKIFIISSSAARPPSRSIAAAACVR